MATSTSACAVQGAVGVFVGGADATSPDEELPRIALDHSVFHIEARPAH